jgi:hypothetical protein
MAGITKKEHWAKLYRRALFKGDRNKLPLMLKQAHQAVQQRVRELRCSPTQRQNENERRDLGTAAHYLGLLRPLEAQQHRACLSQSIFQRKSSSGYGFRKHARHGGWRNRARQRSTAFLRPSNKAAIQTWS